jgi:hypothetical protein
MTLSACAPGAQQFLYSSPLLQGRGSFYATFPVTGVQESAIGSK